jgi:hypothetical protein
MNAGESNVGNCDITRADTDYAVRQCEPVALLSEPAGSAAVNLPQI